MATATTFDPQYVATQRLRATHPDLVIESSARLPNLGPGEKTLVIAYDHAGAYHYFTFTVLREHTPDSADLIGQELRDPGVLVEPNRGFSTVHAIVYQPMPAPLLLACQPDEGGADPTTLIRRMAGMPIGTGLYRIGDADQAADATTRYLQAVMRIVQNPRHWKDWFTAYQPMVPAVIVAAVAMWHHGEQYCRYTTTSDLPFPGGTYVKSAYGC